MKILKHFYFSEASEPSEALYKISEGFRKEQEFTKPLRQNKRGA